MLRVTIEHVPKGNEALKRTIGVMQVSNVGGTDLMANYRVLEMPEANGDPVMYYLANDVTRHRNVFTFLRALYKREWKV